MRIYREKQFFIAERGTYNLDTKEISAETLRSSSDPVSVIAGKNLQVFTDGHYEVLNGDFTTDDSSDPDFHLHATRSESMKTTVLSFRMSPSTSARCRSFGGRTFINP